MTVSFLNYKKIFSQVKVPFTGKYTGKNITIDKINYEII